MKAKYISEIAEIASKLDEHQVLYLLTFIKMMFGKDE